ncbi:hypothetical protein BD770DRAFT_392989 [Pilaira anomala]|nr:hypothetical protein BD770DRAFT_392989 [Pilaira anomala]
MISIEETLNDNKMKVPPSLRREVIKDLTPSQLLALQNIEIQQIISNHSQEEIVTLKESEINTIRWILKTTSTQLEFNEETYTAANDTSIPMIELKDTKEMLNDLHDNQNRDINPTPKELKQGEKKLTKKVRDSLAISIIMTDVYQKPVDSEGPEVHQFLKILKKMAREVTKDIPLTLVERGIASNLQEARKVKWKDIPNKIRTSACLLLENKVLKTHGIPISRCKNMWLASHLIYSAYTKK